MTVGDESSSECSVTEYKLQKKKTSGNDFADLVGDPIIGLDNDQIIINKGLTTVAPYEIYLMVKTKGGVISRKKLLISTTCVYTLTQVDGANDIVLPFVSD